ncbi:hypothetical protein ACEWY4_002720 [Coilia grayii]|uniref:Uncharacterized protein n=1 Tax=Coilia grayii TaxID=363190 RepID=A0ABD1KP63_9TELE
MSHPTKQTDSAEGEHDEEATPLQDHVVTCENGDTPHCSSSHGCMFAMKQQVGSLRQSITSCCSCCPPDPHHRKLAIASIICGLSCVGATALIYSVKAEERKQCDPQNAQLYSDKAKCRAVTAIALGVAIPILLMVLVILGSYLLTLID